MEKKITDILLMKNHNTSDSCKKRMNNGKSAPLTNIKIILLYGGQVMVYLKSISTMEALEKVRI